MIIGHVNALVWTVAIRLSGQMDQFLKGLAPKFLPPLELIQYCENSRSVIGSVKIASPDGFLIGY